LNLFKNVESVKKKTTSSFNPDKENIDINILNNNHELSSSKKKLSKLDKLVFNPPKDMKQLECEGVQMMNDGESFLFLGGKLVAQNYDWLKNKNIKAIINATEEVKNFYESEFEYLRIPVSDSSDTKIIKYFDSAIQFICNHFKKKETLF